MRSRLRPAHSPDQLAELYSSPYCAMDRGADHIERVALTAGLAVGAVQRFGLTTAADLSAGDGELLRQVAVQCPDVATFTSDLVPHPSLDTSGPIESTISKCPDVGLFVCSETLEHLNDPDEMLAQIGNRARYLLLSTPNGEPSLTNTEHYWSWDTDGIRYMAERAGWRPLSLLLFTPTPLYYTFQIWLMERTGS